ncbi:MAG: ACP S-malonyltransferase [Coriobacteriia bacterium]|nr:ACP S-malonyltransferase [Coriobacteriia bacterium]
MVKLAFAFAGQGAQYAGMGEPFYDAYASVRGLFDQAERQRPGITELCFKGPAEALGETLNTQPAMFLADLASALALRESGIEAAGAAGFSLGEIPALAYTGIMEPAKAFEFVCFRAQVMQEAAKRHPGGMLAVLKLTAGQVEELCSTLPEAFAVNYNCPGQTVVACSEDALQDVQAAIAQAGGKCLRLAVSGAFHSPLMDEASTAILAHLQGWADEGLQAPRIPLFSNVTAMPYGDPRALLAAQVNHPVLWQASVEHMLAAGYEAFVEVGPGQVLSGLIKKIVEKAKKDGALEAGRDVRVLNVNDLGSLAECVKELEHA